jgi:uncharacterized protein
MYRGLSLPSRILLMLVYSVLLLICNRLIFGIWSVEHSWFWIAIGSLLLGDLIAQPFFTAPKDAFANAITIISGVVSLFVSGILAQGVQIYWNALIVVAVAILVGSAFAMSGGNSENPLRRSFANGITRILGVIGTPRLLFTLVFILTVYTFHREFNQAFWLFVVWVVIVLGRPLEKITYLYEQVKAISDDLKKDPKILGQVVLRKDPGLVTVNIRSVVYPDIGQLVLIPISSNEAQLGIVLDNYRLADERWSRILLFADRVPRSDTYTGWSTENTALYCDKDAVKQHWLDHDSFKQHSRIIGCVIEESDISLARIELFKDNLSLREGQLLSISINGEAVLYQIVNGVAKSESLQQLNRHGFTSIEARKLGKWNDEKHSFEPVSWIPQIYTPVRLEETTVDGFDKRYIGYIPQTTYGVQVNCNELVTHNTAVLGVLGSGKTSLALELIGRMINEGIKVFIIDISRQYDKEFSNLITNNDEELKEFKTRDELEKHIKSKVEISFKDKEKYLHIVDPSLYKGGYQPRPTIPHITRLFTEEILDHVKKEEITDKARICLVLEEAHSLVPEWNSVTNDADKIETNATARALLQGRKYGFGCLLITQRTANVTKSILNQCNTIFGLRVFDATGMEFLNNYIGKDYSALLATLPDRQCIAFGKGLATKAPLIVRLNDREDFKQKFKITQPDDKTGKTEATKNSPSPDSTPW